MPLPPADPPLEILRQVTPVYPALAVNARVQGVVIVVATVDVEGRVSKTLILRSVKLLDDATLVAVRRWQFLPAAGGRPADVMITVNFTLAPETLQAGTTLYSPASAFDAPLPSWMPANLAFKYSYACRGTTVRIDSLDRVVRRETQYTSHTSPHTSNFELTRDQAVALYLKLIEVGFFEPRDTMGEIWRERPRPEQDRRPGPKGFLVHVTASVPSTESPVPPSKRGPYPHRLEIRTGQTWRSSQWAEPLKGRFAEDQGLANVGAMIREIAAKVTKPDTVKRDAFCL